MRIISFAERHISAGIIAVPIATEIATGQQTIRRDRATSNLGSVLIWAF